MSRIATCTERGIHYDKRFSKSEFKIHNIVDAISHATCGMSIDVHAKAIAVCSLSGKTVRMVSRFRSPVDILGITTSEKTWRKLALSWGVTPVMCETLDSTEVLFYSAKRLARKMFDLKQRRPHRHHRRRHHRPQRQHQPHQDRDDLTANSKRALSRAGRGRFCVRGQKTSCPGLGEFITS